ncbi:MAG: hypothetical protein K0R57_6613, partial [Paenibacillaceae bacterium]|nr:hypothetical protein [Paenibacillaceae bacterium]
EEIAEKISAKSARNEEFAEIAEKISVRSKRGGTAIRKRRYTFWQRKKDLAVFFRQVFLIVKITADYRRHQAGSNSQLIMTKRSFAE